MYDPEMDARVREYVQFQREARKVNVIDRDACSQLLALQQRHAAAAAAAAQAASKPLLVARSLAVQDATNTAPAATSTANATTSTSIATATATEPSIPKEEFKPAIKSELKADEVKLEPQAEASGDTSALPTPPISDTAPQQSGTSQSIAAEALGPTPPTGGTTAAQAAAEQPEADFVLVKSEHDHWRVRVNVLVYCKLVNSLSLNARSRMRVHSTTSAQFTCKIQWGK